MSAIGTGIGFLLTAGIIWLFGRWMDPDKGK